MLLPNLIVHKLRDILKNPNTLAYNTSVDFNSLQHLTYRIIQRKNCMDINIV